MSSDNGKAPIPEHMVKIPAHDLDPNGDANSPTWLDRKFGPKAQINGETHTLKSGERIAIYRRKGGVG